MDRSDVEKYRSKTTDTKMSLPTPSTSSGKVTIGGDGNLLNVDTTPEKEKKTKIKIDNSPFWDKFDPMVKERIYKLIEKKDCRGLQKEFNIAGDNMDRLQNAGRSASKQTKLMDFLDSTMSKMGCYD